MTDNKAPEDLMLEKEQGGGGAKESPKEFTINKSKLSEKEYEDQAKKDAELKELEKNFETKPKEEERKEPIDKDIPKSTQRVDGQQWVNQNPGETNINRVKAGSNLIEEINTPQSDPIARGLQKVIKRIGGF